jgi:hypothetical protein
MSDVAGQGLARTQAESSLSSGIQQTSRPSAGASSVPPERVLGSDPTAAGRHVRVRGLSAGSAGALVLALSATGMLIDDLRGAAAGAGLTAGFLVGTVWAALTVMRRDLLAAVTAPPLVYATCILLAQQLTPQPMPSGWLAHHAAAVFLGLAQGAPTLFGGTALAAVIVVARRRLARRGGLDVAA